MGKQETKTTYSKEFYDQYSKYLLEDIVRANHDKVFADFRRFTLPMPLCVVDLGCALGEYSRYGHYVKYLGVDVNNTGQVRNFMKADYRNVNFVKSLPFTPNAFVSLFSIEPVYAVEQRYALYEVLFAKVPSLQYGLSSGFFYESRRNLETVRETGALISYQTIEDPSKHISPNFSEFRNYLRTPSKMFGNDVVEVWKILARTKRS